MNQLPDKPKTATFVRMYSPDKPHVFAFGASFPSGTKLVVCTGLQPKQVLALDLSQKYSEHLVGELIKQNDWNSVNSTNWSSATAAIQAIIHQFNDSVREAMKNNLLAIEHLTKQ